MKPFIITIVNDKGEYPLNMRANEYVNLDDYVCRAITADQLDEIKTLSASCPDYKTIAEILEQGLELHIWKHKSLQ